MKQALAQARLETTQARLQEPALFRGSLGERDPSLGQVFTPREIASRMARLSRCAGRPSVRVLDPGSGHGILSWFLVRHVLEVGKARKIQLDGYEIDPRLSAIAEENLTGLFEAADALGLDAAQEMHNRDFLRDKWPEGSPLNAGHPRYDIVVMNPPYYKIRKDSDYSVMGGDLIHGQPNVYALFLVLGTRLLKEGGELIAIVPRSWLSGSYFTNLRREILSQLDLTDVQAFPNRSETFGRQKVLQETIVFRGVKRRKTNRPDVLIQVIGANMGAAGRPSFQVPWTTMAPHGIQNTVRIPESVEQLAALRELDIVKTRMEDVRLRVSTGPVVAFRSKDLMLNGQSRREKCALVWIDNVRHGHVDWPGSREDRNPRWIATEARNRKLLIEGEEMVLVRRFSAKEDRRRVIAAHLPEGALGELVGVENHVNVIRGFAGRHGHALAEALTNYLNSDLVDEYLRACSGTTQINASDLRTLPVPPAQELIRRWSGETQSG